MAKANNKRAEPEALEHERGQEASGRETGRGQGSRRAATGRGGGRATAGTQAETTDGSDKEPSKAP